MSSSNSAAPDPLAALVAALEAEAARWERLAGEERDAASRLSASAPNGDPVKEAQLRGWASARVLSAKAVRRVISEHAATQARRGTPAT